MALYKDSDEIYYHFMAILLSLKMILFYFSITIVIISELFGINKIIFVFHFPLDKPRFDEKTPAHIWVSEEAVQQGGPLSVNISCIVYADPVATIGWFTADNRPVDPNRKFNLRF